MKYVYAFILIFILNSCLSSNENCGSNYGYTKSSFESKKIGVFISYYYTPGMKLTVPNYNIKLKIKEIYREHQFKIGKNRKIIPLEKSLLIIRIYGTVPDTYYVTWKLGDFDNIYFTRGTDYFDADLSRINKFDTIKLNITKDLYSDNNNEIIGKIIFIEK